MRPLIGTATPSPPREEKDPVDRCMSAPNTEQLYPKVCEWGLKAALQAFRRDKTEH